MCHTLRSGCSVRSHVGAGGGPDTSRAIRLRRDARCCTDAAAPAASEPYARDLFEVLSARMAANPALHVVVCTPEEPDYPFGFNPFSDYERAELRAAMLGLPTANVADAVGNRVVAFHPRRLPGPSQPTRTTTVIVDDVWALVGSSTFRRRGLTFDGGTDVVVTDQNLVEGRSPTIAALRRSLQANRLGIAVPAAVATGLVPPPFVIFRAPGRRRGGVPRDPRDATRQRERQDRAADPANPDGRPPTSPSADIGVVNPDSDTYDLAQTLLMLAFASGAAL